MSGEFDVVVIGGGIHGCGVAQAAAAAGHSVLVLEKTALAHGTSSRSSKLIHGGLRYLEQFDLSLVRECLRERRLLLQLAPQLVRLRDFHIPVYGDTSRRAWQVRAGLCLYSLLGGLRREMRFSTLEPADWENPDGLATDGLDTVFRYQDAQTDDAALTRAVMASAAALGAGLACPARFLGAELSEDGIGVTYRDDDAERHATGRVLVNAAGPWINEVLERITPAVAPRSIERVQGTHLLLDHEPPSGIYYVEAPSDRRPVFVMPHPEGTLVGTTEIPFHGGPDAVQPTTAECDYLAETVARYFPDMERAGVKNRYAGVRVLPAGPGPANRRSRETILHTDSDRSPHVLSIYGGKLTSYRATAEKVLRLLKPVLPPRQDVARTDELVLEPVS